jgi:hypothetical protein
MGSFAELHLGNYRLAWSKNALGFNFSDLFMRSDLKVCNDGDTVSHYFETTLGQAFERLELIGHSLENAKRYIDACVEGRESLDAEYVDFEELLSVVARYDVSEEIDYDGADGYDPSVYKFAKMCHEFAEKRNPDAYLEGTVEYVMGLDPLFLLRLFAEKSENRYVVLRWDYYDLVQGGWVNEEDVYIRQGARYLIVTEGTTDSSIIKEAFDWLKPDVGDCFSYVDMHDNYPFTGCGNMVNFYHGLCKVEPAANVIMIFDNDAAGISSMRKCVSGSGKIKLLKLPDLPDFESVKCIGPSGQTIENINGKAVSIEMFLDLNYKREMGPMIRWSTYFDKIDRYQGALECKDCYTKLFFEASKSRDAVYDIKKLRFLLDYIISNAISM